MKSINRLRSSTTFKQIVSCVRTPNRKPRILGASICASLLSVSASADIWISKNLMPLYETVNYSLTDYFLTINQASSSVTTFYGYSPQRVVAYVIDSPESPLPIGVPLYRAFKGYPQFEHFYTANFFDRSVLQSYGYVLEGSEGGVLPTRERYVDVASNSTKDSTPMYRLSKFWPSTGDLAHKYTLSDSERSSFVSAGYTYEGITGYAFPPEIVTGGYSAGPSVNLSYQAPGFPSPKYNVITPSVCSAGCGTSGAQTLVCPGNWRLQDFYGNTVYTGTATNSITSGFQCINFIPDSVRGSYLFQWDGYITATSVGLTVKPPARFGVGLN
jgi:hypothetical protein